MKSVFFFYNCCQSALSDADVLQAVKCALAEQRVRTESRIPNEIADVVSMGFAQSRPRRYVIPFIIRLARMSTSSLPLAIFGAHKRMDNNSEQRSLHSNPHIFVYEKYTADNFFLDVDTGQLY